MVKDTTWLLGTLKSILNNEAIDDKDKALKCISKIKLHFGDNCPNNNFEDLQPTEIRKYDIIKSDIDHTKCGAHYGVVCKVDEEFKIAWVIYITSDITMDNIIPIKESRLFKTFFVAALYPIKLNTEGRTFSFCGIYDATKEFDSVYKTIKNYYKINFK